MTIEARDVVEERVVVPPREGRALPVDRGRRFRVVDLEGHQCGDLFAFVAGDVREYASAEHTRVHVDRLFPRPGEDFVTNRRRPILHFEADDSPGVHDMLIAACDPARFAGLGVNGWHASCQENLQRAMAGLGHADVEIPQPINLFTNIGLGPDRELLWRPALTQAGDAVTMRAELDCIVVLSACPQDIVNINECRPGPLAIELLA
jgi:uncharacterized protein YcgI (DUF1989 family)